MTELRHRMQQDLKLAGLSERTIEAYVRAVRQLCDYCHASPDTLTEAQVKDYLTYLISEKKFAPGSLTVAYSGVKFFYRHTCPRDWSALKRLRVPPQKTRPVVLTSDTVKHIISDVRTLHNRTCLWTIYSCGLRLSEGVSLQTGDINAARGVLHIHHGKGAVDRYVPLPESTLRMLREYWKTHRNPTWLFPARGRGTHGQDAATATKPMPLSTVQGALKRVVTQRGITRRVCVHTLRHSWATHCIEAGISLRIIQQYLGHRSLQTTSGYLHLTTHGQQQAVDALNKLMSGCPDGRGRGESKDVVKDSPPRESNGIDEPPRVSKGGNEHPGEDDQSTDDGSPKN